MVYPVPVQSDGAYKIPSAREIGGIFNIPVSSPVPPSFSDGPPVIGGPSPAVVIGKDCVVKAGGEGPDLGVEKPKPHTSDKEENNEGDNHFAQAA